MPEHTDDLDAALAGVTPPVLVVVMQEGRVIDARYTGRGVIRAALLGAEIAPVQAIEKETRG